MKKVATIIIITVLAASVAFAAFLDVAAGSNINSTQTISSMTEGLNPGNLLMGSEVRVKFFFLEAGVKMYFTFIPEASMFLSYTNLDLSAQLELGIIRIGAGLQTDDIIWGYDFGKWLAPNFNGSSDFAQGFLASNLNWRLKLDILLGRLIIGADYTVPSSFKFGEELTDASMLLPKNFKDGRISLSFMYHFF